MAGRVPQFVIAGSLRRTNAGSYELELNLQVKGQTQAVSATVRQGPDLPGLAAALEDVLPSLFGEPAAAKPAAAAATQAPSTTTPERTGSGFFAKPWQPYAAAGGGVLLVIGGGINALATATSTSRPSTMRWPMSPSRPRRSGSIKSACAPSTTTPSSASNRSTCRSRWA